jgi:hypothetical protein
VGVGGGAIFGTVAFSVGICRKSDRSGADRNLEYSTIAYGTEAYIDNHNHLTLPHSTAIVEEYTKPHQPH